MRGIQLGLRLVKLERCELELISKSDQLHRQVVTLLLDADEIRKDFVRLGVPLMTREAREVGDMVAVDRRRRLRGRRLPGGDSDILPLYARLSTAEQNRVFEKHTRRRIVLATNVAESSLTVPGIRYVVDTGTARISRYTARSKVQRLPIEAVSQASANQRAGRCGRERGRRGRCPGSGRSWRRCPTCSPAGL